MKRLEKGQGPLQPKSLHYHYHHSCECWLHYQQKKKKRNWNDGDECENDWKKNKKQEVKDKEVEG